MLWLLLDSRFGPRVSTATAMLVMMMVFGVRFARVDRLSGMLMDMMCVFDEPRVLT